MDTPEKIPLHEAVARDMIPCSVCGAKGADVQQVEGKKHFLCAACAARSRRWGWGVLVALVAVLAAVVYLKVQSSDPSPDEALPIDFSSAAQRETLQRQIVELMDQRRYHEAASRIAAILSLMPHEAKDEAGAKDLRETRGLFSLYLAQCYASARYFGRAVRFFQVAMAADPKLEKQCQTGLGEALQALAHSAQAAPYLEKAAQGNPANDATHLCLAECYIDLGRYADGLKLLEGFPTDETILHQRFRALYYMGKPEEARKVFDGTETSTDSRLKRIRSVVLAMQAREDGDFAGALKIYQEAIGKAAPDSVDAYQLRHMALQIYLESGDLVKFQEIAAELSKIRNPLYAGEAKYYHALGLLLAGKKESAVAVAKEFLGSVDLENVFLRTEVLMMQHLAGQRKEEDVAKEASEVNRFRANDMYFYLALATGKKEWAQKAAEVTPGHNFPYHAIQRLLKK